MVKYREGAGAINNIYNSTSYDTILNDLNQQIHNASIKAVRVKSIILNSSHPRYNELGGDNGVGIIMYDDNIKLPNPSNVNNFPWAAPLYSNVKNYPLINELVYIFDFPSTNIGNNTTFTQTYYINTIALWNHPHHNAYPDNPSTLPPSQNKDYKQTDVGSTRRVTDQSTEIKLGDTFKERSNIHPLLPFEGDIIYEGRWGNSIRFGSTVQDRPNNWSITGTDGDPILILRNGQLIDASDEGWIPIVEDINRDISSIYLTSTQTVPIEASSPDYYSYESAPIIPNVYQDKQIILNSGRLLFNSNLDHILLSSQKSIGLSAVDSVNIDTKKVVIQSNKLYLGSKNANEPLLLGGSTILLLKQLIDALNSFMNIASTTVSTAPGTPLGPLNAIASQTAGLLQLISVQLDSLKSKDNFTI